MDLCNASEKGDLRRVHELLGKGTDINAKSTLYLHEQCTALFVAVRNNQLQMIQYLLQAGADVEISAPGHGTPLRMALTCSNVHAARLLLRFGAIVNKKDKVRQ
jgi:uncharacterized protein